jgi:hypothetical protein
MARVLGTDGDQGDCCELMKMTMLREILNAELVLELKGTLSSLNQSPMVTYLAYGDYTSPGYSNHQAKPRVHYNKVRIWPALLYDVLHRLESINLHSKGDLLTRLASEV